MILFLFIFVVFFYFKKSLKKYWPFQAGVGIYKYV